jgi:hypothetical protein
LDTALANLRQAGQTEFLPPALLSYAWLHALASEWDAARERLDEAFALATRASNPQSGWQGSMRLQLADTLLHRARLFGRRKDDRRRMNRGTSAPTEYPWPGRTPAGDLAEAAALITACG